MPLSRVLVSPADLHVVPRNARAVLLTNIACKGVFESPADRRRAARARTRDGQRPIFAQAELGTGNVWTGAARGAGAANRAAGARRVGGARHHPIGCRRA